MPAPSLQTVKSDFKIILALSLASEKEKLLKEVTTMLSFEHHNVMSLIGVCFDGQMPLIIMPYMSKGSVLGYVKQNKTELLFESVINEEEVCSSISSQLLLVCKQRSLCPNKIILYAWKMN